MAALGCMNVRDITFGLDVCNGTSRVSRMYKPSYESLCEKLAGQSQAVKHENKSFRGQGSHIRGGFGIVLVIGQHRQLASQVFSVFPNSPHPDQPQRFHDSEVTRTGRPRSKSGTLPMSFLSPTAFGPAS